MTSLPDAAVASPPETAPSTSPRTARSGPPFWQRYLLIGLWLALILVFVLISPERFLSLPVALSVFSSADVYVFLGLAVLLTFYVGEIDLSVPFVFGLSATLVPSLYGLYGVPLWVSIVIALAASVAVGVVNAYVVLRVGVDPLVTTLGVGTVVQGLALVVSNETPQAGLPPAFTAFASTRLLGLTVTFWSGLLLAVLLAYLLYRTPLGRRMTFVGANHEVARLSGISVDRVRAGSYVFGSLIAGIGGVFVVARLGGFDASSSTSYLMPMFATVFASAAVITLGRFNPFGVLIGAYFISTGTLGLKVLGLTGWTQQVFYGGALILAVSLVTVVRKRSGTA